MRFRGDFAFLSNMHEAPIRTKIGTFRCSESVYQAAKSDRYMLFKGLDGYAAKRLARTLPIRPDWDVKRVNVMRKVLWWKFDQHPDLLERLRAVEGEIVEDNTWGDVFWGRCNGVGENMLGKLLMEIRTVL